MSLVRMALRIAVVQALRGRTLVGDNVLDSRIGVIEVGSDGGALTNQNKPFIAVYTGAGESEVKDLRALNGNGLTWLVFELGATAKMAVMNPDTDASEIVPGIPATDDALELMLDLTVREIGDVLTDPGNAWADIYRGLVTRVTKIEIEPLRSEGGQRLAARQVRIAVELAPDPVLGERSADDSILGPFLKALDAVPGPIAASQAGMIREAAGVGGAPDWQVVQRRMGMTAGELRALGLGPIEQDEDRSTPALTAVEHDVRQVAP